ncbi:hypothetical protein [Sphingobacterium sp. UBA5670]|uniref:hypothetical protein n=1 Tax=Sphingobacterium sp. UBA5670 TaxID=1947502 RepID=UPI0025D15063|nr:hypothetical protein [Sphingobacterium sp. UBA5670]
MGQYFWIAIPAELFFQYCGETMEKHGGHAYIEKINRRSGKRNYVKYSKEHQSAFLESFSSVDYHGFYLSTYPFSDQEAIVDSGVFYDSPVAECTIAGSGGYETDKTREIIHLRQIMKQADKSAKAFFAALQRSLKKIPDLHDTLRSGNKNHFYLPTSKSIIPQNAHSRLITIPWEEHCLSKDMVYRQE